MSVDHQQLAQRLMVGISGGDLGAIDDVFTEDVVEEYPQSGELIRGRENVRGIMAQAVRDYASGEAEADLSTLRARATDEHKILAPLFTVVHVQGRGDAGTITLKTRFPDGVWWWVVVIYEVRGDKIARASIFFAPEFPPAEWRAEFVERTEPET
jgi:hypothetical protein